MTVTIVLVTAVLVVTAVASLLLAGRSPAQRVAAFVTIAALALLGLLGVLGGSVTGTDSGLAHTLLVDLFLVAVLGGSPVTATVLWLVDRGSTRPGSMDRAGEVLRGGAWIGAFERCAVFASLASGWPEGLAVVLALKGLGRYSELRGAPPSVPATDTAPGTGGVAERFIIGTFASVLWAVGCAGTFLALRSG
jgi:hypothetical protein